MTTSHTHDDNLLNGTPCMVLALDLIDALMVAREGGRADALIDDAVASWCTADGR
jgi:hypothetical protein